MPGPDDYWRNDGSNDPYTDPETGVLCNKLGLSTQAELEDAEAAIFQANYPQACNYISSCDRLDLSAWQAVHKTCFGDIYDWAGELRTILISKGDVVFAYPAHIQREGDKLLNRLNTALDDGMLDLSLVAELFAETNMVHPFREGNGRTQRILFEDALRRSGYRIDYSRITQDELINVLRHAALSANYTPLITLFERMCEER